MAAATSPALVSRKQSNGAYLFQLTSSPFHDDDEDDDAADNAGHRSAAAVVQRQQGAENDDGCPLQQPQLQHMFPRSSPPPVSEDDSSFERQLDAATAELCANKVAYHAEELSAQVRCREFYLTLQQNAATF